MVDSLSRRYATIDWAIGGLLFLNFRCLTGSRNVKITQTLGRPSD